jgi:hypothetical protein
MPSLPPKAFSVSKVELRALTNNLRIYHYKEKDCIKTLNSASKTLNTLDGKLRIYK